MFYAFELRILALSCLVVLFGATLTPALAQEHPQCKNIRAAIDQINRGGGNANNAKAIAVIKRELGQIQRQQQNMRCGVPQFMVGNAGQCSKLEQRFNQLLYRLRQLERGGGGRDTRRLRQLQGQYQRLRCGQAQQRRKSQVQVQQQTRPKTFFDLLFGGGNQRQDSPQQQYPNGVVEEPNGSGGQVNENPGAVQTGKYRTLCVRACDGYFFPVSFSTHEGNFDRDAKICGSTCPGQNVSLFYYPNPGGVVEDMVGLDGTPYSSLPTAFRYKQSFDKSCTCKRADDGLSTPRARDYGPGLNAVEALSKQDAATPGSHASLGGDQTTFQDIKTRGARERDEATVLRKLEDGDDARQLIVYLNHLYGHPRDTNEVFDTAGQQMRVNRRGSRDVRASDERGQAPSDVRVVLPWLGERVDKK